MNPSASVSASPAVRQGTLSPIEMLVLAFLIAAVAVGAVMSAKLLQQRVRASNPLTATLSLPTLLANPPLTRPV